MTLSVQTNDPLLINTYTHQIRAGITHTDHPTVEEFLSFTLELRDCPLDWTIDLVPDTTNSVTGAAPHYFVIDVSSPNTANFNFVFNPVPINCPITWTYEWAANGGTGTEAWGSIDQSDPANPFFSIITIDNNYSGTHTVQIWAVVDDIVPEMNSKTVVTPVTLDFSVFMVDTYCV